MTSQYLNISPGPVVYGQDTVYYTFPVGGTYQVCYNAYDSTVSPGCNDQDCILALAVGNTPNTCGSLITPSNNGNGNYTIYANPNTPNGWVVNYAWNFGDGTTSNANPANHSYALNGTYTISVYTYAYDPNDSTQWCDGTTSITQTVTSAPAFGCNAGFTLWQDSLNPSIYYGYNTSTGNNLYYLWDFGDGTTSNSQYPSHTYATTGLYSVCLTVTDSSASCTSTWCDSAGVFRMMNPSMTASSPGISQLSILAPTSVKEQPGAVSAYIFPNPVSDNTSLSITSGKIMKLQVAIVNAIGQTLSILTTNVTEGKNTIQINTTELSNGIYFLRISEGGKIVKNIKLLK
jgi:hypothetical protein